MTTEQFKSLKKSIFIKYKIAETPEFEDQSQFSDNNKRISTVITYVESRIKHLSMGVLNNQQLSVLNDLKVINQSKIDCLTEVEMLEIEDMNQEIQKKQDEEKNNLIRSILERQDCSEKETRKLEVLKKLMTVGLLKTINLSRNARNLKYKKEQEEKINELDIKQAQVRNSRLTALKLRHKNRRENLEFHVMLEWLEVWEKNLREELNQIQTLKDMNNISYTKVYDNVRDWKKRLKKERLKKIYAKEKAEAERKLEAKIAEAKRREDPSYNRFQNCSLCGGDGGIGGRCPRCSGRGYEG